MPDATAEQRYMVLPERPAGTEGMSEEQLASLVTRDAMIGVLLVSGATVSHDISLALGWMPGRSARQQRRRETFRGVEVGADPRPGGDALGKADQAWRAVDRCSEAVVADDLEQ